MNPNDNLAKRLTFFLLSENVHSMFVSVQPNEQNIRF